MIASAWWGLHDGADAMGPADEACGTGSALWGPAGCGRAGCGPACVTKGCIVEACAVGACVVRASMSARDRANAARTHPCRSRRPPIQAHRAAAVRWCSCSGHPRGCHARCTLRSALAKTTPGEKVSRSEVLAAACTTTKRGGEASHGNVLAAAAAAAGGATGTRGGGAACCCKLLTAAAADAGRAFAGRTNTRAPGAMAGCLPACLAGCCCCRRCC
eukprot:202726-Chlamydomonas_euryale.AAC.5